VAHAGNGYFRPDGSPEEAVDCQKMFSFDLHTAKLIIYL
jgi:hypothetical protein